jgi:hypothetical protein
VSGLFVEQLTERLKHKMEKKDTNYKCAIPIRIRVTYLLYKLIHALDFLQHNELFVIEKSIVHLIL